MRHSAPGRVRPDGGVRPQQVEHPRRTQVREDVVDLIDTGAGHGARDGRDETTTLRETESEVQRQAQSTPRRDGGLVQALCGGVASERGGTRPKAFAVSVAS